MAVAHWLLCPKCKSPYVKRLGSLGERGVADSAWFRCETCGSSFKVKGGESFREAFRSKGL
jgi:transposase-like protein